MVSPVAMLLIASRATSVILGNKKPLEVLCISKAAETCGFEVPIPTCARILKFQAINSQLKRHPQFVLYKKGEPTIFVLVKATNNIQKPNEYDVLWMETFKNHAKKQQAKVWFAGVGIANAASVENPVFKDQPYYIAFEEFIKILE
jgi:hypothetical protein